MMPELGSSVDAIGIIRAMAVIGPKPGNMPMKVPAKQPVMRKSTFSMLKAVCSPVSRPSNTEDLRQWRNVYTQHL